MFLVSETVRGMDKESVAPNRSVSPFLVQNVDVFSSPTIDVTSGLLFSRFGYRSWSIFLLQSFPGDIYKGVSFGRLSSLVSLLISRSRTV